MRRHVPEGLQSNDEAELEEAEAGREVEEGEFDEEGECSGIVKVLGFILVVIVAAPILHFLLTILCF